MVLKASVCGDELHVAQSRSPAAPPVGRRGAWGKAATGKVKKL